MDNMLGKKKFLSNKEMLKDAIIFCILMNENRISALHLQKLLGLKKQSIYNYLKELVKENKVIATYEQHPHRPHLLVNYYSISKKKMGAKEVEMMDSYPQLATDPLGNLDGLDERLEDNLHDNIPKEKISSVRSHLDTQLNYSIAGILIIKQFLDSLEDSAFLKLLQHDFPNFKNNPDGFVFTHTEYSLLLREIFNQTNLKNKDKKH